LQGVDFRERILDSYSWSYANPRRKRRSTITGVDLWNYQEPQAGWQPA
jgi:hypothetical protein